MKKVLRIALKVLGGLVVLIGIGAAYIHIKGIPSYPEKVGEIPTTYKVEVTPERVAQGLKISSMQCNSCHMSEQEQRLSGNLMKDAPPAFGKIYSMNITNDTVKGIGAWTDGELAYFLRTGVRKDGTYAPPLMPKLNRISEEDLQSIIAFLRSSEPLVQPSKLEPPVSEFSFLTKFLCNMLMKPLPFDVHPATTPTEKIALGKYLANDLYDCAGCHSADFKSNNDLDPTQNKGFYGGGNAFVDLDGKPIFSANITFDEETGIGKWTSEQFIAAVKYGQFPNGKGSRYPMLPKTQLDSAEIAAIYAYLKTIPKIKNPVQRNFN